MKQTCRSICIHQAIQHILHCIHIPGISHKMVREHAVGLRFFIHDRHGFRDLADGHLLVTGGARARHFQDDPLAENRGIQDSEGMICALWF
jgi:hypothetical protein